MTNHLNAKISRTSFSQFEYRQRLNLRAIVSDEDLLNDVAITWLADLASSPNLFLLFDIWRGMQRVVGAGQLHCAVFRQHRRKEPKLIQIVYRVIVLQMIDAIGALPQPPSNA